MIENLIEDQRKQLELAEKLFRTAGRSKGEAEQYTAKAMAILESLNMDMSVLEQSGGEKAKRSDAKFDSGRYEFERDVWSAVADLHFCRCWCIYEWDKTKVSAYHKKKFGMASARANPGGYAWRMRLVGRTVNVIASKNMATYVMATIERLLKDHMAETMRTDLHNSTYCISFRQGVAAAIVSSVYARRQHLLDEEARKAQEAAERAAAAGVAGDTSRALSTTITSVAEAERIANYDFLHGEGAWARKEAAYEANRARRAAERKAAQDAYTQWAAENPEEARKQEQERLAEERKQEARRSRRQGGGPGSRGGQTKGDKVDWRAYSAGEKVGRTVSIDPQAEGRRAPAGLL